MDDAEVIKTAKALSNDLETDARPVTVEWLQSLTVDGNWVLSEYVIWTNRWMLTFNSQMTSLEYGHENGGSIRISGPTRGHVLTLLRIATETQPPE